MGTTTIIFIAISFVTTTCFGYCLGKGVGYRKGINDVVRSMMRFSPNNLANLKANEAAKKENT